MKKLFWIISAIIILCLPEFSLAGEYKWGSGYYNVKYFYWQKQRQTSDDLENIKSMHEILNPPDTRTYGDDIHLPKGYGESDYPKLSNPFLEE